jgi:hypothetical protein
MRFKTKGIFLIFILFIVISKVKGEEPLEMGYSGMEHTEMESSGDESLGVESFLTTLETETEPTQEPSPESEFLVYETITEEAPEPEPAPDFAPKPSPELIAPVYEPILPEPAPSSVIQTTPTPFMPPPPAQGFKVILTPAPAPEVAIPQETIFRTALTPTPQISTEIQQIEDISRYEAPKELPKEAFTVTIAQAEPKEDPTSKIKSELISILQDTSRSGTIELFNTNIILESTGKFNQAYLQNYPSASSSIYAFIKNFYENRIPATLGNLQTLLTNASGKSFLTSSQKSEVRRWLTQVQTEIKTTLEQILKDPTKSGTPVLLNTNVVMAKDPYATPVVTASEAIFNQVYLQNYPSASASIYSNIKKFYENRTPDTMGNLQILLVNAQNKNFLTAAQKAEVKKFLSQIKTEVKNLLNTSLATATNPTLLNTNIILEKTGMFDQAYLQNYPSASNSIYTAIKQFYEKRIPDTLITLQNLLAAAQNKAFLTASQNANLSTWLEKVTKEHDSAQTGEMRRVNRILKGLTGKTFDVQVSTLQKLEGSINPIYDYTTTQQNFSNALQALHKARPSKNSTALQGLQAWYATLLNSNLVSDEFNFAEMMSDIENDINKLTTKPAEQIKTEVDSQVVSEINKALAKSNILDKVNGLKDVANNFGSQQVSSNTIRLFASSIMLIIGNDLNKIISAYQAIMNEASKTTTLTTPQKNKILNLVNLIKKFQQQLGQEEIRSISELFYKSVEPSFTLLNQAQKNYVTDPLKRTLDNLPYILSDLNKLLGQ